MLGLPVLPLAREISLPGVSAPRGPRLTDDGDERETWKNPVAFAGLSGAG